MIQYYNVIQCTQKWTYLPNSINSDWRITLTRIKHIYRVCCLQFVAHERDWHCWQILLTIGSNCIISRLNLRNSFVEVLTESPAIPKSYQRLLLPTSNLGHDHTVTRQEFQQSLADVSDWSCCRSSKNLRIRVDRLKVWREISDYHRRPGQHKTH